MERHARSRTTSRVAAPAPRIRQLLLLTELLGLSLRDEDRHAIDLERDELAVVQLQPAVARVRPPHEAAPSCPGLHANVLLPLGEAVQNSFARGLQPPIVGDELDYWRRGDNFCRSRVRFGGWATHVFRRRALEVSCLSCSHWTQHRIEICRHRAEELCGDEIAHANARCWRRYARRHGRRSGLACVRAQLLFVNWRGMVRNRYNVRRGLCHNSGGLACKIMPCVHCGGRRPVLWDQGWLHQANVCLGGWFRLLLFPNRLVGGMADLRQGAAKAGCGVGAHLRLSETWVHCRGDLLRRLAGRSGLERLTNRRNHANNRRSG
mmetsp:Transcript_63044/g.192865  ORF Transcript_63044/g.192865 Transcript_63044/m.192865 type:complete len:321 (-) Transcript_63044:17-979(-)